MIRIDLRDPQAFAVWRDNPIGAFYELARRAPGQTGLLVFPREEVLIVQDAVKARHILRKNGANYRKNFGGFMEFFGVSRITADGPQWEKLHKLSQPYINASRPEAVVEAVRRNFSAAVRSMLDGRDEEGGLAVDANLSRAAAAVVSEVAIGFDSLEVDDALIDDFRAILDLGSVRSWNFVGVPVSDTSGQQAAAEKARARLSTIIRGAVDAANERSEGATLLRELYDGQADGVDLFAEVCSLLFAGFDTSAAALGWGLFLLATMPDLQNYLRQQIVTTFGSNPLTVEGLSTLHDITAFQNEVLRMFPPIPILGRTAVDADDIDGLSLRPGAKVLVSIIGLHHDSRFFDGPATVRLKRYANGQPVGELANHLLPFGAGRRMCGGVNLANVELTAAFALLIRELEFSLPDQRPVEFAWTASLRRKGGQYLLVRPAHSATGVGRAGSA